MDNPLDQTTLATISLLESRLSRVEHLLYGPSDPKPFPQGESALRKMTDLQKRFSMLLAHIRVYGELLKIYNTHPDFFHAPAPSEPPSQLAPDAIQAIVLASAPAFPATQSALTAINDCPIPDPSESAALIDLGDRMKAIEATQAAQAAEMSELRQRSEAVMRSWYENGVLRSSQFMAETGSRVDKVEQRVRRQERQIEDDSKV